MQPLNLDQMSSVGQKWMDKSLWTNLLGVDMYQVCLLNVHAQSDFPQTEINITTPAHTLHLHLCFAAAAHTLKSIALGLASYNN